MASTDPKSPRAFTSYSWSSPAHEQWVLHVATKFRESGVPGQNPYPKALGLPAHEFQVTPPILVTPENGQRPDPSLSDMMRVSRDNNTSHPRHAPNFPYPQELSKGIM